MGFCETGRPTFSTLPLLNHQYRGRGPGAQGWPRAAVEVHSHACRPNLMRHVSRAGAESHCCFLGVSVCGCTDGSET